MVREKQGISEADLKKMLNIIKNEDMIRFGAVVFEIKVF